MLKSIKQMIKKTYWIFIYHLIFLGLNIFNLLELSDLESIKFIYQLFGFFYITFLPGFLFVSIISKEKMGFSKKLLFSLIGSISFLMIFGFIINFLLPIVGIRHPLSEENLFSIVFVLSILLSMIYLKKINDSNSNKYVFFDMLKYLSDKFLMFAILFPIIPFIGSYYQNYYKDNIFNIFLILLIVLYLGIYSLSTIQKSENEDLIIYFLSLGLLLHYSLISDCIFGYDTHFEYFTANQVINNGIWNPSGFVLATNQMLSSTILPAFYVKLLGIDLTYFIKIIYPILFAFVPLGLYGLYRKISNRKIAFFSVIFFIFQIGFFTQLIMNLNQGIAEIFFILMLLLIFDRSIEKIIKSVFFVLCSFSIVVSHYGLSYFAIGYFVLYITITRIIAKKTSTINNKNKYFPISGSRVVLFLAILVFLTILGAYTIYVPVSPFSKFIKLSKTIFNSIPSGFFSAALRHPAVLSALGINPQQFDLLRKINAYIIQFSYFCIFVGAIKLFYKGTHYSKNKIDDFRIFIFISLIILSMCVVLPYFSRVMQVIRIYHITLFILSICFTYGFFEIFKFFKRIILFISNINIKNNLCPNILAIYLIIFLLFQTGLIHYFAQQSSSAAISLQSKDPIALNSAYTHLEEVYSARWLYNYKGSYKIYSDSIASQHVLTSYGNIFHSHNYLTKQKKTGYAYLRFINIEYDIIPFIESYEFYTLKLEDTIDFSRSHKIYSNNKSEIYLILTK